MTLLMGATAKCGHTVTIEESDDLCYEDRQEAICEAAQELCPDCKKLGYLRSEFAFAIEEWIKACKPGNMLLGATIRPYPSGGKVYEGMYAIELRDGTKYRFKIEDMPVFHLA
jgi:hypothetical protein